MICSEYHITGYPTSLLLFNGKLIGNYRESRDNAIKIKKWIIKQLKPTHLRDAEILEDDEIELILKISSNKNKYNKANKKNKGREREKNNFKIFPWEFNGINDLYYSLLGDIHPTIPFIIYVIGTLSGIIIGVGFVFCVQS